MCLQTRFSALCTHTALTLCVGNRLTFIQNHSEPVRPLQNPSTLRICDQCPVRGEDDVVIEQFLGRLGAVVPMKLDS